MLMMSHIHLVGDSGEAELYDESDRQALRQRLLGDSRPLRAPARVETSSVGSDR